MDFWRPWAQTPHVISEKPAKRPLFIM